MQIAPTQNPNRVDTNDIFYSNHHGVIQYSTFNDCNNAGFQKALDDESIKSFSCIEVRAINRNILGYYLEIRK